METQACSLCGHTVPIFGIRDGEKTECPSCTCRFEVSRQGQARVYGEFAEGHTVAGPAGGIAGAPASQPKPSGQGDTAPEATPKSPIPGYVVLEELGRGGMAVVFKAQQTSLDRIVALKIMSKQLASDPDFVKRFEREAKALAALNHPNITSVYDRGQAGDKVYFVMEFVEGHSLRDVLKHAGGRMPQARALDMMIQVGEALSYVHARGTIHRDIKPENVMITEGDGVKVTDFGLAAMANKGPQGNLTGTGMMMGTLNYMPPEQRVDAASVDHRADIYAFGVMLYELLTGQIPVGQWDPASTLIPNLDKRLDEIITRSLKTNRNERYQSIDEALGALKEVKEGPAAPAELNIPLMGAMDSKPPAPAPTPAAAAPSGPSPARISDPGSGFTPPPRRGGQNQDLERLVEAAKKDMLTQRTRGLPTKIQALPGLDPPRRRIRIFLGMLAGLVLLLGGGYVLFEPTVLVGYLVHTPSKRKIETVDPAFLRGPMLNFRVHAAERLKSLADGNPDAFRAVLRSEDSNMVRLALRVLCTSEHAGAPKLIAWRLLAIKDDALFERCAATVQGARTETSRTALQLTLSQAVLDRAEVRAETVRKMIARSGAEDAESEEHEENEHGGHR